VGMALASEEIQTFTVHVFLDIMVAIVLIDCVRPVVPGLIFHMKTTRRMPRTLSVLEW
jgi:hypothetical protein